MEGLMRLLRADGSARDVENRSTASILPGLHLSVLRDVTERRRVEARFRAMIEKGHEGTSLVDAGGTTIYTLPLALHLQGDECRAIDGHVAGVIGGTRPRAQIPVMP